MLTSYLWTADHELVQPSFYLSSHFLDWTKFFFLFFSILSGKWSLTEKFVPFNCNSFSVTNCLSFTETNLATISRSPFFVFLSNLTLVLLTPSLLLMKFVTAFTGSSSASSFVPYIMMLLFIDYHCTRLYHFLDSKSSHQVFSYRLYPRNFCFASFGIFYPWHIFLALIYDFKFNETYLLDVFFNKCVSIIHIFAFLFNIFKLC